MREQRSTEFMLFQLFIVSHTGTKPQIFTIISQQYELKELKIFLSAWNLKYFKIISHNITKNIPKTCSLNNNIHVKKMSSIFKSLQHQIFSMSTKIYMSLCQIVKLQHARKFSSILWGLYTVYKHMNWITRH